MKGYRTLLVGLFVAIAPVAAQYFASVDWTQYLPPQYAPFVAGAIIWAMRFVTNTPVGEK
jgi:hypothetical protein